MYRAGRIATLLLLGLILAAPAHGEQFDRTVPVSRGTRLDVRLFGGQVEVRAWNQDAVRIQATHFRTDTIDVRTQSGALRVGTRSTAGLPHAIDFEIDVPAWMAVTVAGTYVDVAIDGTGADVKVDTVRGDIRVTGGAGSIALRSVEGEVILTRARGRAELSSTNNLVRVTTFEGELLVDTIAGAVKLQGVTGSAVAVGTMSGDIAWDGTMVANGRYEFATHSGDVDITVPERASATVSIRLFEGRLRVLFPLDLPDESARRKRFTVTIGTGSARLTLETFSGTISLRRGVRS